MVYKTKNKLNAIISQNWVDPDKKTFNSDDIIDAYLKGKEKGIQSLRELLDKEYNENLEKAKIIVQDFTETIIENNFNIIRAFLRINDIDKYDALFVIPSKDFLSANFIDIYNLSKKIKKEVNNENFYFDFAFMPFTENLNKEKIESDRFYFRYGKKAI